MLVSANLNASVFWEYQDDDNPPFQPIEQGQDGFAFDLNDLDIEVTNEGYFAKLDLDASEDVDVDLSDFINLVRAASGLQGVICIMVKPTGGNVRLEPSPVNGLQWFFDDLSYSLTIRAGGVFLLSNPPDIVDDVSPSAGSLRFTNVSTSAASVLVAVLGEPV